ALRDVARAQADLDEAERLEARGIGTSPDAEQGRAHAAKQRLHDAEAALGEAELRRQAQELDSLHQPHTRGPADRGQAPARTRTAQDASTRTGDDRELPPAVSLLHDVRSLLGDVPDRPQI